MTHAPPLVSVVIPVRQGGAGTLAACLHSLERQSLPRDAYEIVVVIDAPAPDASEALARSAGARLVRGNGRGAARARNHGIAVAAGQWVAFTDADCIPSRTWLATLLKAADRQDGPTAVLGVARKTLGYRSDTDAARYVDRTGGLDAERHLAHPRFPWAPTGNVMYRTHDLRAVGGFDARFVTYEGCDLHLRLTRNVGGQMLYEPSALVLHQHRAGWRAYWQQQVGYGRGYAQFVRQYRAEIPWPAGREARAWLDLVPKAIRLARAPSSARLQPTGDLVKALAQRTGFDRTFWSPRDRRRWRQGEEGRGIADGPAAPVQPDGPAAPVQPARPALSAEPPPRWSPRWTPWGAALRLRRIVRSPADVALFLRIGWFMLRLPGDVERLHLTALLANLSAAARPAAPDPWHSRDRIARLRAPWLRRRGLRGRDTCYVRALTLYRFVDRGGHDVEFRVGAEWFDRPGGVLRGHAWVEIDGTILEGPPESEAHGRLQPIALRRAPEDRRSTVPTEEAG